MQVVILCGGKGTRIRGVSDSIVPKPMVPVGSLPILLHIMHNYASAGHTDFILCLGYLSDVIKQYFLNYRSMGSDVTVKLGESPEISYHSSCPEEGWRVTLADTGTDTGTGERIARIEKYLNGNQFMLTYGDGLSNVKLDLLEAKHREHGGPLTITGVIPPGRFGELTLEGDKVTELREKPPQSGRYINGGFMMINRSFISDYLSSIDDDTMLEKGPFERAAQSGDMFMYKHNDFWQCMDTPRDWEYLNQLAQRENPPWRT